MSSEPAAAMPPFHNPALLKLKLGLSGIATGDGRVEGDCIELLLDGELWARAEVNPKSALRIVEREGSTCVTDGSHQTAARVAPEPEFAGRLGARGVALGAIARVRGSYAGVALGGGCGLGFAGRACAFCLGRELTEKAGEVWEVGEVVDALRAAFDEGAAEAVHLQLGYFPGDDAGVQRLLPYLEAIRRHFDTMIVLSMHPPATQRAIDLTYAAGVDALSYNLEAADADSMKRHFPGRARFFGRKRYLEALGHAARVFPTGAVWSELAVGLSAPSAIRRAIEELTRMGVLPLLSLRGGEVAGEGGAADLAALCAVLFNSALKSGLNMTWARDISTALTPLEARYFVPDAPQLPVLLQQLARNRLGALATRSLARLRRRLRVKRVRASFESSRL